MRRPRQRWLFLLVLAGGIASFTSLWYAARTDSGGDVPAFGGSYIEGVAGAPARINPLFAPLSEVDDALASLVFSGLTRLDDKGRPFPDLAEGWEVSEDGRVYTFRLRRGVLWHDGAELTADDVLFTYRMLQAPDARIAPGLDDVLGQVSVSKVDALTVTFATPQPFAALPAYLKLGILPRHLLGGVSAADLFDEPFNQRPVGTGPYRLLELTPERAVLTANPAYHLGQPYIQRLELRFYRDDGAVIRALQARQIEAALLSSGVNPSDYLHLQQRSDLRLYTLPGPEVTFVYLNLRLPMFGDRRVRQALLYALDRDQIVAETLAGQVAAADSPLPPGSWPYSPALARYDFDPGLAGLLLDEAGWRLTSRGVRSDGRTDLELTLATNSDPVRVAVAEEISKRWAAVGVKANVSAIGATSLVRDLLEPRSYEAALFAYHGGVDPDPYPAWHSTQTSKGGRNLSSLNDTRVDRILEDARLAASPARRFDLYREFQEIFAQEVPALPLYASTVIYVQKASVRGARLGYFEDPGSRFWQVQDWHVKTR